LASELRAHEAVGEMDVTPTWDRQREADSLHIKLCYNPYTSYNNYFSQ
jgi:hypothetical protein